MTSQLPCFVGELSKKKQTLTTVGFWLGGCQVEVWMPGGGLNGLSMSGSSLPVKNFNLVLTCLLDCSSKPQSQFNLTCPNFSCQVRGQVRLGVKNIVPYAS